MSVFHGPPTANGASDEPLLVVSGLTTRFPTERGPLTAVDDVSFTVNPGEIFGLVGESGSGKTATIRSLIGLVPRPGKVVAGSAHYRGQDLLRLDERRLRAIRGREIAMIFQDPATALNPVIRVETQITGGMAQRVVIAIAIAANPHLLLADEPTTALDVTIQDQILALLVQLQRDRGMGMIL